MFYSWNLSTVIQTCVGVTIFFSPRFFPLKVPCYTQLVHRNTFLICHLGCQPTSPTLVQVRRLSPRWSAISLAARRIFMFLYSSAELSHLGMTYPSWRRPRKKCLFFHYSCQNPVHHSRKAYTSSILWNHASIIPAQKFGLQFLVLNCFPMTLTSTSSWQFFHVTQTWTSLPRHW